jgi:hypothetical protein
MVVSMRSDGNWSKNYHFLLRPKSPPDIIHISMARFTKEMDLEPIKKIVERHTFNEEEIISKFELVNTTVLPFDRYQAIRTYPLLG